jgi:hypothetical protein
MLIPNGSVSENEISNLEMKIGFGLPSDYRGFLSSTNGGQCSGSAVSVPKPGDFFVDYLFGLGLKKQADLAFWQEEFYGDIPEKSLIIGSDAGGGFLLLCLEEEQEGVYYYDHSHLFPSSSEKENTYFICAKFSDFFNLIK